MFIIVVLHYLLSEHITFAQGCDVYVFRPFQSFRNSLFNVIPFSIGDVFYFSLGALLTVQLLKLIWYAIKWRTHHQKFISSSLALMICVSIVYLVFLFGWGSNYYNRPLSQAWALDNNEWDNATKPTAFDSFLVDRINIYAVAYKPVVFKQVNHQAQAYYNQHAAGYTAQKVFVKFSLFGNFMELLNIQGYYNPFTGEAQVNRKLPFFMLPFVICHEMAHQCGIAAEDDANLLSYALCTAVADSNFLYSAYFNIWLYTHAKLKAIDSVKSTLLKDRLNGLTIAHIDTLRQMRKKYKNTFNQYASAFYDGYLKLHQQGEGIGTYNKVTATAWALEEKRKKSGNKMILLP